MAAPEVDLGHSRAKLRDPAVTLLLSVVTLGIYVAVWYYMVHRELRDLGEARGDAELAKIDPAIAVLAVTLGGIIIVPAVVSWWRAAARARRAQELMGLEGSTEPWIVLVCYLSGIIFFLPFLALTPYVQSGLNRAWERLPHAAPGAAASIPPAASNAGYCVACGAALTAADRFCTSCGSAREGAGA